MNLLQEEILSFGQQYANNDQLYGIYIKCIQMSQNENVTRKEFELLKKKEPVMEQMFNYARYLSGSRPSFQQDVEMLQRHVYHLQQLISPTAKELHALNFIQRQLQWAKNEDYNAYKLNNEGLLNENGQYNHGHINDTLYNLYEKTLDFIRRLEDTDDEFEIENIKMEYDMFRRDLFQRIPYRTNSAWNQKKGGLYKEVFLQRYSRK